MAIIHDRETGKTYRERIKDSTDYNHDIIDLKAPEKSLIARAVVDGWWKLERWLSP